MVRVFLLLIAFLVAAPAAAQTYPPLTGRVVDNAHLLTPDQAAQLSARLEALERASSRQLVVATMADLQGSEIEDYANGLFRTWRLGQAQANNGVLLLVAVAERKVRIEVGYGLEGILTDALSSQIISRDIRPHFRDGDYPGGIAAGVDAIVQQLQAPPEAAEQRVQQAAHEQRQASRHGGSLLPALMWFIVIFVVIIASAARRAAFGRRYGRGVSVWGPGTGSSGLGGGLGWMLLGMAMSGRSRSGWGGGGSSWGGGGWGGGGGFSGGGGSSGGGGASGGW